jgi:hypothetical protein
MKNIEGFKSFEAVGVPKGLVEISGKLYDLLIKKLNDGYYSIDEERADPDEYKYPTRHIYLTTYIRAKDLGDVKSINDYEIKEFNVLIKFDVVDFPEDRQEKSPGDRMAGAGYGPKAQIDRKNFKTIYEDDGLIDLQIKLMFSEPKENVNENEYWERMVIETFEYNKARMVSSIGHEIMHAYDLGHVKGGEEHKSSAKYAAYNNIRFGIKPIDDFLFYLYYTTRCESMVRNAEVASAMDAQGAEQEKFEEYLTSNETYKMLKQINEWTFDGFVEELKADMDEIKKVINPKSPKITEEPDSQEELEDPDDSPEKTEEPDEYSDDEIIDKLIQLVVHNINTSSIGDLIDKLRTPSLFGMSLIDPEDDATDEEKQEYLDSFIKVARRDVQNPVNYFKDKEKFFRNTTNKLLKKLSKLYSLAKPSASNPLHAKISAKVKRNESKIIRWKDFGK